METYRRDFKDYKYYSISLTGKVREYNLIKFYEDLEEEYLSNEDIINNSLTYNENKEKKIKEI
jgi:hypothetical protein